MRRRSLPLLVFTLVLVVPAIVLAAAAGGGGPAAEHHVDWKQVGFDLLNFAIFVGGLVFLLRRPLREFLTHRRATLAESLDEAARLRSEAERRLSEFRARLANLDAEREKILAQYREEGEAEKARIEARARQTAEVLRRELGFRLEQEARELRRELRRRAVDAALTMAERILREELTARDRVRLADDYIAELQDVPSPSA